MAEFAVYGANCVWWDTIDKTARTPSGLPCCPHCGSVLFQQPLDKWWADIDKYEANGHPGYRKFVEWWRGKCFPTMEALERAYAKVVLTEGA